MIERDNEKYNSLHSKYGTYTGVEFLVPIEMFPPKVLLQDCWFFIGPVTSLLSLLLPP